MDWCASALPAQHEGAGGDQLGVPHVPQLDHQLLEQRVHVDKHVRQLELRGTEGENTENLSRAYMSRVQGYPTKQMKIRQRWQSDVHVKYTSHPLLHYCCGRSAEARDTYQEALEERSAALQTVGCATQSGAV